MDYVKPLEHYQNSHDHEANDQQRPMFHLMFTGQKLSKAFFFSASRIAFTCWR